MRKRLVLFTFVLVLLFPLMAWGQTGPTLGAVLTGDQEVPGPGDPDGSGNATFTFNADRTQVTVDATFSGIGTAITGAHIHQAPPGSSAGVAIGFSGAATITDGRMKATVAIDPSLANQIIANPYGFYFNIHTQQFPSGAIRGQLSSTGGVTFIGDMNGAREVPGPGHPSASGTFVLSINEARDRLTYAIATTGLTSITNSHVHGPTGPAGTAAGVFVGLGTAADYANGSARGTVTITSEQAAAIIANPSNFYVNVHTSELPSGAIRGQLVAGTTDATGNTTIIPVVGRVTSSDLFVTNARIFNSSFDEAANVMIEFFPVGDSPRVMTVKVPARGTAVLNDIVGTSFGMTSGIGGARVTSTGKIVANVRIIADRRSSGGGTYGQLVPGLRGLPRRGIMAQVQHDAATRTNIGMFNPSDSAITIRLQLRDASGTAVGTSVRTLAPYSFSQTSVPQMFTSVTSIADATLTFDASAPAAVYISVIDNVTNDPLAVVGVPDPSEASAP
jgi:hypothetical protein